MNMHFRRSRYPLIFVLFFIVVSLQYLLRSHDKDPSNIIAQEAKVIEIIDGDTVTLRVSNSFYRARLIGIDAPEMGQKPWGERAKRHLEELIRSAHGIKIETDIEKFDKYNRLLVYLLTEDGRLINEQMLLDGYAVLFTVPPNVKYVDRFIEAEKVAKEHKKGIWGRKGLKEMPLDYKRRHGL